MDPKSQIPGTATWATSELVAQKCAEICDSAEVSLYTLACSSRQAFNENGSMYNVKMLLLKRLIGWYQAVPSMFVYVRSSAAQT